MSIEMRKNSKKKKAPVIIPTSCTYHMQVVGTQFKDFSIPNNLSQIVFNSRESGEEFFKHESFGIWRFNFWMYCVTLNSRKVGAHKS